MARAKKKKLSLEELLQQALVKEEDRPYEVPENWVWTRLGSVVHIKGGKRLPKGHSLIETKTDHPYIRVTDFLETTIDTDSIKYIDEDTFSKIKNYTISYDDIYISIAGTIGKVGVIPFKINGANLTENAAKITNILGLKKEYLIYLLLSEQLQYQISKSTIATTQAKLALFRIAEFVIPLPPLLEQQRIVQGIESLFEKLDTAKELAQNALDSFENRKATILHKAFTGELTAKWREENRVSLDEWKEKKFGNYIDTKYGYTESANSEEVGPKFLRITDIQDNYVDWNTVPYCPINDEDFEKYRLKVQDIVVARTGATTGKSYIISEDVHAVFASYLIRINIKNMDKLLPQYLYEFMQSNLYWNQIMESKKGIAQPGVNANKLKELSLAVPTIKEQKEIIRILHNLLENEQQARELCNVIEKIDLMKKAILARAFRGELGTNNPEEESALELLKEVLKEKI